MLSKLKPCAALLLPMGALQPLCASALVPEVHFYRLHMPDVWPHYANGNADVLSKYTILAVGTGIALNHDGQVINCWRRLKTDPGRGVVPMQN